MKWVIALGALLASLAAFLRGKTHWKGRAVDAQERAEEAHLDALGLAALLEKERALAELEKKRTLDNDERMRHALVRAAIRRAGGPG